MTDKDECPVCGSSEASLIFPGPIRRGRFGELTEGAVYRCGACGVDRLSAPGQLGVEDYETSTYRELVGERPDASNFFALHDEEQFGKIPLLRGLLRRGDTVLDVGCAGGAFLDFIAGVAGRTVAIEPATGYHESLRERGHLVYADTAAASRELSTSVDLAVSFSVIEHVGNPVAFLQGIRGLLRPDGVLLVSTPNRSDLLLRCGPPAYRSFFYRLVHRYYFDAQSLTEVLRRASFRVQTIHYKHRFGLANFVNWLRDGQPTGDAGVSVLPPAFDDRWRLELEANGVADYLYVVARGC
jgi:2-polyprenyl-3-methyl-5-hydroxy-6-metoxy-1,4-benzoquinol methylase